MNNDLILVAIIALGLVVTAVMLGGRGGPEPAPAVPEVPAQPIKLTAHGNSALAGGYITPEGVKFYFPSPVQLLRDRLPGVDLVDCTMNGLALTEALRGGPVRMGAAVLGQTQVVCESLIEIWARERPQWAYVALTEVEPLFWDDFDVEALPGRLQQLHQAAQAHGVQLIVQGAIAFAARGPVTPEKLRRLDLAEYCTREWANAAGVPFVSLRSVPFDPDVDVCPDDLHPTLAKHVQYADARAEQLRGILA